MKLSLIIATYNRAAWMTRALESVVRQSAERSTWECIVVNNNSTDDTCEQFNHFAAAHSEYNIRMVVEQEQGLSNARNRGIAEAAGDYIAIVDDDETLEDTFIESYIEFFEAFPRAMVAGGAVIPRYES
ncbi:MAG: glycosyltransferase family 2 protein, partial [Alistipes sp.]|nr:glycosyltransferase family 2 protein [Alistipes sp.]